MSASIKGVDMIMYHGKKMYENFSLEDEETLNMYKNMYYHFAGINNKTIYPSDKGIFTNGTYGVGKTDSYLIMQKVFPLDSFFYLSAKKIKTYLKDKELGDNYVLENYGASFKKNLLIDDVGLEDPELKLFGNYPKVISDLIHERYDLWKQSSRKYKTYIITNFTTDEFESLYGERAMNKISEFMSLQEWLGSSKRPGGKKI